MRHAIVVPGQFRRLLQESGEVAPHNISLAYMALVNLARRKAPKARNKRREESITLSTIDDMDAKAIFTPFGMESRIITISFFISAEGVKMRSLSFS